MIQMFPLNVAPVSVISVTGKVVAENSGIKALAIDGSRHNCTASRQKTNNINTFLTIPPLCCTL